MPRVAAALHRVGDEILLVLGVAANGARRLCIPVDGPYDSFRVFEPVYAADLITINRTGTSKIRKF